MKDPAYFAYFIDRDIIRAGYFQGLFFETNKLFYLFMPGLMAQPLMFTGFIFHQVHLVETKGWSLALWGTLFAFYAMVSVVSKMVTGILVDRFGAIKMVPLVALPMAVGFIILSSSSHVFAAAAFLALTGITVGFQTTVSGPFWAELYGTLHLGAIKSLSASTMVFFSAISPVILGWFIDYGVSIETLSLGAVVYIVVTATIAWYAVRQSHVYILEEAQCE